MEVKICYECKDPEKPIKGKGLCKTCHYKERRKREEIRERVYPKTPADLCACGKLIKAKGLCETHYHAERRRREGIPEKIYPEGFCACGKPVKVKGLCRTCYSRHYQKEKRERLNPKVPKQDCACGEPSYLKGLCKIHYSRSRTGFPTGIPRIRQDKEALFQKILAEVKSGVEIKQAIKNAGISCTTMYKFMSPAQKEQLKNIRFNRLENGIK